VLHARNANRAEELKHSFPQAQAVLTGDLSSIRQTRNLAEQINAAGHFDSIIHNAGVGYRESRRIETHDGLSHVFAINVLAPYILTALTNRPHRFVWLSSGLHRGANIDMNDINWKKRRWQGEEAYAESKLYNVMMAFAVASRWPEVISNALEPGWVPTKMGGIDAPDDLSQAHLTQVWLASSLDQQALQSAKYYYHMKKCNPDPKTRNADFQQRLLDFCQEASGIELTR